MLSCVLIAALAPAAEAPKSAPTLRELCIRAPLVVLAKPVDPYLPNRFTVTAVLRGKGVKVDDELFPQGLSELAVRSFDGIDPETKKPRPRRVEAALLILEPVKASGKHSPFRVLPLGYRLCTDDDRVLTPAPVVLDDDKGPRLFVALSVKWAALLQLVRADVTAVDRLYAARKLPRPQQRVRALTDWLQRRRGELTQSPSATSDLSPGGWYELATDAFDWIFEDATPAEAWAAVRLYASLHRNEIPHLTRPVFASTEGRSVLLGAALDEKALSGDRRRALPLLAASLAGCDEKARALLIERLRPLLADKDGDLQGQAALTLVALSRDEASKIRTAPRAVVNALAAAYRAADPGQPRDELAWSLCRLASAEQYREITTNPPGTCVRLSDFSLDGEEITFFLDLELNGGKVYDQPTLVLEKLGAKGEVVATTKQPLNIENLEVRWSDGVGDGAVAVRLELLKLITPENQNQKGGGVRPRRSAPAAASYRVRIEGSVGKDKDKRPWRSEPRRFSIDAAQMAKLFEPRY